MKRKFEKSHTTYHGAITPPLSWQQQALPPEPAPRKAPDRNVGTIEGDVHVPVLQAVCIAALLSVFGTAIMAGFILGLHWPWWLAPVALVLVWSGLGGVLAWQNVDKRQQLWRQEIILQRDLDGDGVIGPPEEETLNVLITEKNGPGSKSQLFEFGLTPEMAAAFCEQVLRDGDLSIGTWEKTWIDGHRVFGSRNDFTQLRARMEKAGLIAAKNPRAKNQGFNLTAAGRAVCRKTIEEYSPGAGDMS